MMIKMEILLFNLVRRQRKLHMFLGNNNCAVCQELLFNGPLATKSKVSYITYVCKTYCISWSSSCFNNYWKLYELSTCTIVQYNTNISISSCCLMIWVKASHIWELIIASIFFLLLDAKFLTKYSRWAVLYFYMWLVRYESVGTELAVS